MTHPAAAAGIAERLTKAQRHILLKVAKQPLDGRGARFNGHQAHPLNVLHACGLLNFQDAWEDFSRLNFLVLPTEFGLAVAHILREQEKTK